MAGAERLLAAVAIFGLLLVPWPAPSGAGEDDAVPFPVAKSTILRKEGTVYCVEGKQTIPAGMEISVQKGVKISGRGKDAMLLVEGSLMMHGVSGLEIVVEGVDLVLAPDFYEVQTGNCTFRGIQVLKCDIYSREVAIRAPQDGSGATARVLFDRCYRDGLLNPREILEKIVRDGEDDEGNSARARIGKVQKRPSNLAGPSGH